MSVHTIESYARQVDKMLRAQQEYFKASKAGHSSRFDKLARARALERTVGDMTRDILEPTSNLFSRVD
jgi:hypothetical protein